MIEKCNVCEGDFNDGDLICAISNPAKVRYYFCHDVPLAIKELKNLDSSYNCGEEILCPNGRPSQGLLKRTTRGVFYQGRIYDVLNIWAELKERNSPIEINKLKGVRIGGDLEFLTKYTPLDVVDN